MGIVLALGGPNALDAYESVFSTWAIAHGQLACAFPSGFRSTAPLYPLLSGGTAALTRIGHAVPFPSEAQYGTHCDNAYLAINTWSLQARAIGPTLRIGYLSWFALLAGVTSFLRTTRRGRTGWEPAALVFVACVPPVWMCIEGTFHPEDLIAMGFAVAAVACARRDSWIGAGVLVTLAVLSQQFTLLVAVPLFVLAPRGRRLSYAGCALGTVAVAAVPLLVVSSGRAARDIFLGTGDTGGVGGAIVWELHLHGALLVLVSRIAPIALGALLAWWSVKRLGRAALDPVPVICVVAVSLGLRLVFEQQVFGYYYMALAVSLVILDVTQGRIRSATIAWLTATFVVYGRGPDVLSTPWSRHGRDAIPVIVLASAVLICMWLLRRTGLNRRLIPWLALIVITLVAWAASDPLGTPPAWFWQLILVPTGIWLALEPFAAYVRRGREQTVLDEVRPLASSS